jgi:ribonucleoside-diphosphate reductase alpha chain
MSTRARLPDRRLHELIDFEHRGFKFTAGIGRYSDGRPAEIFINAAKAGSPLEAQARDAAILASFALQLGGELDTLRRALLRDARGNPSSPIGVALDLIAEGEI